MTSFVRHRIATVIGLLALNGMAFAQEPVEEVLFDEAPPAIADNLPPDPATAAAELSESDSVGILQPLPPEEVPVRQPTIREEMRPFNSRLEKKKLREQGFQSLPDWRDALHRYVKLLKEEA